MFKADLTPAQCIRLGIFGGCYFHPRGGKPGIFGREVAVDHREFPPAWFAGLNANMYASRRYDPSVNRYRVVAGKGQAFWEAKGWMDPEDPRGWFQWYCRYRCGRRIPRIDDRQIARWRGVKRRWGANLARQIHGKYGDRPTLAQLNDATVSPVVRQTLLHWACKVDSAFFEEWLLQQKRSNRKK
jgi:hypothetical protein